MSLIRCPECNAKVSDKALACPRCGFVAEDHLLPISQQVCSEVVPTFSCTVEKGTLFESVLLNSVMIENHADLSESFGNMTWLGLHLPELTESICSLARKQGKLVADMSPYLQKMIRDGTYTLNVDSANRILPTIRDKSGRIIKQVRLKPGEYSRMGAVCDLCCSIATHMQMAQLMNDMEDLRSAIQEIHAEIQQDRLSKYEAARELFLRAQKISDPDVREKVLLTAIQTASEAKCALMRNMSLNLMQVGNASQKSTSQIILDKFQRGISTKAADAFNDLTYATASCQIESFAYISLGEKQAAADCIEDFQNFLISNHFEDEDTLIMLHGNLAVTEKSGDYLSRWLAVLDCMLEFKSETLLEKADTIKELRGNNKK